MLEAAWIVNHITHVVLCGGVGDNSPMNQAITQLEFLSPTDFMICTRDDFEQPWIHWDHMGTKELYH